MTTARLPAFLRAGHVSHCKRCLTGLPSSQMDHDGGRLGIGFYCLGTMDLLGSLQDQPEFDRESWKEWLWDQQTHGECGSGFRPSPFMTANHSEDEIIECTKYDSPHVIMTYTAILSLAMLRDDFTKLDRAGLTTLLRSCQREDGSFSTVPGGGETDLRTLYCAFAISSMLNDWSGIDVDRALRFVASCKSYEGGYGQSSFCEAHGGITYIALASIYLAPTHLSAKYLPTLTEREQTIRWLLSNQFQSGGFCGRTNKVADSCYCFWCGASLKILGASEFFDATAMASFLATCQFKFGGISKHPGEHPDPYHTYLSIAALSINPPSLDPLDPNSETWKLEPLDPLLNAKLSTAAWIRKHVPAASD
ncbi:geranylgeranyltransferase type I [Coprinopsis marcescibilis]|uniref:Geranylgeranyltransferase type I n=1 Tax=Coprinopsis marcescibilis TaxID=230819 RepID=A0A5C3L3U9_COPMA|nr:geranylgeranyltransferase type I [Coprinopsis marcescibilis]